MQDPWAESPRSHYPQVAGPVTAPSFVIHEMGRGGKPFVGSRASSKCGTGSRSSLEGDSALAPAPELEAGPPAMRAAAPETGAAAASALAPALGSEPGVQPEQLRHQLRNSPAKGQHLHHHTLAIVHEVRRGAGDREGPSWAGHPVCFGHSIQSSPSPPLPQVTAPGVPTPASQTRLKVDKQTMDVGIRDLYLKHCIRVDPQTPLYGFCCK